MFENEPLVELETDKVTQEVPSPAAGVLAEILLDTDDEAEPGALLAKIDPSGDAIAPKADEVVQQPAAPVPDCRPAGPRPRTATFAVGQARPASA